MNFNPPTRKGWDRRDTAGVTSGGVFQSTHPQGVGLACISSSSSSRAHFNPPTRKGWDLATALEKDYPLSNFNPPTRKGWDRTAQKLVRKQRRISIHPPARGGTAATSKPACVKATFQSTHPQGVGPKNRQK